MEPTPTHYTIGATYTHEPTGFVGTAQAPDRPVVGKTYLDLSGDSVVAIGPHPTNADLYAVAPVESYDEDGGDRTVVGHPEFVGRASLPINYPRVALQAEAGAKGAPERRYFDIDDLTPTED